MEIDGPSGASLGVMNPLTYRGYVYDYETGLYYLQSRYYNPTIRQFISPDAFVSTGQGYLGYNMFAYCNNNPVIFKDSLGTACVIAGRGLVDGCGGGAGGGSILLALFGWLFTPAPKAQSISPTTTETISDIREEENEVAITDAIGKKPARPIVIYRYYASKTENLWPRQGKDYDGLSFSTKPPKVGISAVATTIEMVNATGVLVAIPTGGSHLLVIPTNGTVEQWMNQGYTSIWTQALSAIVIEWTGGA